MTCGCNPSTLKDCLEREDRQGYTLGRKEETNQMKEKKKKKKIITYSIEVKVTEQVYLTENRV